MTPFPPEPPPEPQAPPLDRALVDALIEYATAQSDYSQWHVNFVRSRGKEPDDQSLTNANGWAFVALALSETYDS